jgi:hypothetical protein
MKPTGFWHTEIVIRIIYVPWTSFWVMTQFDRLYLFEHRQADKLRTLRVHFIGDLDEPVIPQSL